MTSKDLFCLDAGEPEKLWSVASVAEMTMAAEIERLRAELAEAREQLLSEGWCPDDDDPTLAQLCAHVASAECEARRQRDEAYALAKRLQAIVDRLPKDASGRHVIAHEDELYHPKFNGGCGYYDGEQAEFYCGCGDYDYYPVSECWPTKDAAEKARKT